MPWLPHNSLCESWLPKLIEAPHDARMWGSGLVLSRHASASVHVGLLALCEFLCLPELPVHSKLSHKSLISHCETETTQSEDVGLVLSSHGCEGVHPGLLALHLLCGLFEPPMHSLTRVLLPKVKH